MATLSAPMRTDQRILDVASRSFGTRGFDATSLDDLGHELGLAKQTILYWFPSKQALLDAAVARGAAELSEALDRSLDRASREEDRVEVVLRAAFRFAVRRPELLGLVREVSRLGEGRAADLRLRLGPLVDRAQAALVREMNAGTVRRADPAHVLLFTYSMVIGVATDIEAQRALGIDVSIASLARLRRELLAFLRAALSPIGAPPSPAMALDR
ncbi:MAG TPA: TetR/AcrR family transcriptional regulator [Acidimicrobiales bacterium]|nr:TetR/AcrR family transcriptional regulator [Acidimicrobiales bacterium]